MELCFARKRLARLELLRLVLLLFRRFGVNGLFVPLGRGLQLGRVVLRSLLRQSSSLTVFVRRGARYSPIALPRHRGLCFAGLPGSLPTPRKEGR